MQELIWAVQPDLIVETGIAHGGSLIFWSSLLELNAACGGPKDAEWSASTSTSARTTGPRSRRTRWSRRITMIEGSSVDRRCSRRCRRPRPASERVLVCLDSNHTHAHVLAELEAYAPLTSVGSYCVVFDTVIEDLPAGMYPDRPWGPGDNPKTAVREYLASIPSSRSTNSFDHKLLISVAPGGYLKRVRP